MLFPTEALVMTPGAADATTDHERYQMLARHFRGDWGNVCPEDAQTNDEALRLGNRILSAYTAQDGTKVWIITEADRSVTTFLLPEEY